jgi:hypothetical protein
MRGRQYLGVAFARCREARNRRIPIGLGIREPRRHSGKWIHRVWGRLAIHIADRGHLVIDGEIATSRAPVTRCSPLVTPALFREGASELINR